MEAMIRPGHPWSDSGLQSTQGHLQLQDSREEFFQLFLSHWLAQDPNSIYILYIHFSDEINSEHLRVSMCQMHGERWPRRWLPMQRAPEFLPCPPYRERRECRLPSWELSCREHMNQEGKSDAKRSLPGWRQWGRHVNGQVREGPLRTFRKRGLNFRVLNEA